MPLHKGFAQGQAYFSTQLATTSPDRILVRELATGHVLYALGTPTQESFAARQRQATELLATAIAQVRTLPQQLLPTIVEDFGLAVGLREICRNFCHPPLHLHCAGAALPPLPLPLALACYRIAQELVGNLVQHAGATAARLQAAAQDDWLTLHVTDNGRGFDSTRSRPPGLGLNAVRDRVQLLGGELSPAYRLATPRADSQRPRYRYPDLETALGPTAGPKQRNEVATRALFLLSVVSAFLTT